jgi:hypothetical protein
VLTLAYVFVVELIEDFSDVSFYTAFIVFAIPATPCFVVDGIGGFCFFS